ncbi:hypothetical protein UFOVP313_8 [uncultured Caudovirales phage]|jgi:hypothetical protein|uniref:Uncharacterized protein n=1 Tax=uncultured Caudovirales phage TaxID=2100421 RepID=A0A6J5LYP8_9CAUD|nr:hypothetical protein UFOVP313_8 [uncultured Caudovirales phage]
MKETLNKLSGIAALGSGAMFFYPLAVDVIEKGQAAYSTCLAPVSALWGSIAIFTAAVWQKKK